MNNALKKLISLDVVEKIKPINAVGDKKALYAIKSNSIRFYHRYIYMLKAKETLWMYKVSLTNLLPMILKHNLYQKSLKM